MAELLVEHEDLVVGLEYLSGLELISRLQGVLPLERGF